MFARGCLSLLFAVSVCCAAPQGQAPSKNIDSEAAAPIIGWDSLKTEFLNSGIGGGAINGRAYNISIAVDSIGQVSSVRVTPFNRTMGPGTNDLVDSLVTTHLEKVIGSTAWSPARRNNRSVRSQLDIPVIFPFRSTGNDVFNTNPLLLR